jgi:hypothetical protein
MVIPVANHEPIASFAAPPGSADDGFQTRDPIFGSEWVSCHEYLRHVFLVIKWLFLKLTFPMIGIRSRKEYEEGIALSRAWLFSCGKEYPASIFSIAL